MKCAGIVHDDDECACMCVRVCVHVCIHVHVCVCIKCVYAGMSLCIHAWLTISVC